MKAIVTIELEFDDPQMTEDQIQEAITNNILSEKSVFVLGDTNETEWVDDYHQIWLNSIEVTNITIE